MTLSAFVPRQSHHRAIPSRTVLLYFSDIGLRGVTTKVCPPASLFFRVVFDGVLPIYMEVWQMRLPMALFAFGLLFAFWLGALFLHLHGGLTTYSLLLIALTLLVRTRRVTDGARS